MARRLKMCHQERAPTAKHVYIAHNCAVRSKRGDLSSHVRPELVLDDHTQLGNKLARVLRASHQLRARRVHQDQQRVRRLPAEPRRRRLRGAVAGVGEAREAMSSSEELIEDSKLKPLTRSILSGHTYS